MSMTAISGFICFSNRHYLTVEPNGVGQWNWRYVNGDGNTLSEGTVSADSIADALSDAADAAEIPEALYA